MRNSPLRTDAGFTLIELLTVMVLIGILATIAIPRLRSAIYNAEAANILGDVHAVQIAYAQFMASGGVKARNSGWGNVPADLAPFLPDGFNFATDVADYRFITLKSKASPWGTQMGELRVRPKRNRRPVLVDKLAAMSNQAMIVKKKNQVRFYLVF